MERLILYPDTRSAGAAEIETAILGGTGRMLTFREDRSVPDAVWRRADAVVCYDALLRDAARLANLQSCRIIVRAGVGVDNIDVEACRERGIPVCNTPDYGTTDVADHAMGLLLALSRSINSYDRHLRLAGTSGWDIDRAPTPIRLSGRVLGVVGLGRIGTAVALRAKAFGMKVAFYDPYAASGIELSLGLQRYADLEALLPQADVITLHTPLTPDTRQMIDREALRAAKPGAILINTSRGGVVDTEALFDALASGHIGGAGLDVFPAEPPSMADPIFGLWLAEDPALHDRLILTPHAAFYSAESIVDLRRKSAEIVRDYFDRGQLRNCVNAPVRCRPV